MAVRWRGQKSRSKKRKVPHNAPRALFLVRFFRPAYRSKGTLFRSARAPVLWVCEGKAPALAREALKQTRLGAVAGEGGITEPITACERGDNQTTTAGVCFRCTFTLAVQGWRRVRSITAGPAMQREVSGRSDVALPTTEKTVEETTMPEPGQLASLPKQADFELAEAASPTTPRGLSDPSSPTAPAHAVSRLAGWSCHGRPTPRASLSRTC